jgi:hypothetical protein
MNQTMRLILMTIPVIGLIISGGVVLGKTRAELTQLNDRIVRLESQYHEQMLILSDIRERCIRIEERVKLIDARH